MRAIGAVLVGLSVLALAACSPTGVEVTSTPPPASATPDAQPEPVAARVVFDAERLSIAADDGTTLASFDYFQPATDVVPTLVELFGEPAVENVEPSIGGPGLTVYDWGGLQLYDNEGDPVVPYTPDLFFVATAPEVAGIVLETIDGVRVGDSGAALEARYPDESRRVTVDGQPERIDIHLGFIDHPDQDCCESFSGVTVWVVVAPSDGAVVDFRAPSPLAVNPAAVEGG